MKKRTVAAVELLVMKWEDELKDMATEIMHSSRQADRYEGRMMELGQRIAELKDTLGWDEDRDNIRD